MQLTANYWLTIHLLFRDGLKSTALNKRYSSDAVIKWLQANTHIQVYKTQKKGKVADTKHTQVS